MKWFFGELKFEDIPVRPVERHWICPIPNCGGEMKANGMVWPMSPAGYHHVCDKCGEEGAVSGESYPKIVYLPEKSEPTVQ